MRIGYYKKTVVSLFMVIAILFTLSAPAFASNSPYDKLIRKGFPSDYLDSLSNEMLNYLYDKIDTYDIKNVSTKTVYLSETETEFGVQQYADISSNSLSLHIVSAEICRKNTNIITGVCVGIDWSWLKGKPTIRMIDSIAVNWDSSLFYLSSEGFLSQDKWCLLGIDSWVISKAYNRPAESNQGGIGYYTKLTSDPNFRTAVGGDTLIILEPCSPMYSTSNPEHGTSINVNYVHNRSIVIPSFSFSKNGTAVAIDKHLASYSASATANFKYSK